MLTGIPGIIPVMVPAAGAGVTDHALGTITVGITARECAWAAARVVPGRNATSTGISITMARVVLVTVVVVRVMHRAPRLMNRMFRVSTRVTRVVVLVMAAEVRVLDVRLRPIARAGGSESGVPPAPLRRLPGCVVM